jgi:hypothetical protein
LKIVDKSNKKYENITEIIERELIPFRINDAMIKLVRHNDKTISNKKVNLENPTNY